VALNAAVLRIDQFNIAGLPRDQVAHVMQHAGAGPIAKARLAALRAGRLARLRPPEGIQSTVWSGQAAPHPHAGSLAPG
jgi:hypothetical protein